MYAQSNAHDKSKFAIVDPFYNSKESSSCTDIGNRGSTWIYGDGELECWRLKLLRQRKDSAKLMVGYPGTYYLPSPKVFFKLDIKKYLVLSSLSFTSNGRGFIYINDILVDSFLQISSIHIIKFKDRFQIKKIQFDIIAIDEPPALLIENNNEISTSNKNWQWKLPDANWEKAYHYPKNITNVPPHRLEAQTKLLYSTIMNNNIYDFGKELFGYLSINKNDSPNINIGESKMEALDIGNPQKEQPLSFEKISQNTWRSRTPVALRYVYAPDSVDSVRCEVIVDPVTYQGAFACSDSTLTKIWMSSAYTLRNCMHDFLLDGIKRDRLPWAGDLLMSMMVDAYSFSNSELPRRSLVALGKAGIEQTDINGIIDYSLWWIIAQDQYQLYFNDHLHLSYEWNKIKNALKVLQSRCDSNGFLKVNKKDWLFIDWVDQNKWSALQILWWWAQNSGISLAKRMGDFKTATYLNGKSIKLTKNLLSTVWDKKEETWFSAKDSIQDKKRHSNFLAVLSGLTKKDPRNKIKSLLENKAIQPVGTPYMAGFEAAAIAQLGDVDYMLNYIKEYWGGMLNKGATTFWEAYDDNTTEENQYSFYDRPYGKSLCHAWSAAPVMVLSSQLFGLKPLQDGWKRFTIHPNLGWLKWASVCVPTKHGNILIDIEHNRVSVSIPQNTTLEWKGKSIAGPRVIKSFL